MPGLLEEDVQGVRAIYSARLDGSSGRENLFPPLAVQIRQLVAKAFSPHQASAGPHTLVFDCGNIKSAPNKSAAWGLGLGATGSIAKTASIESWDVRMVRGPLTHAALVGMGAKAAPVFGEPAMLVPAALAARFAQRGTGGGGVVVLCDGDFQKSLPGTPARDNSSDTIVDLVSRIHSADLVVSDCVEIVALAEAYCVPARFMRTTLTDVFACRDYLAGSGRATEAIASDVDHAVQLGGHLPPTGYAAATLASFPVDLWGGGETSAAAVTTTGALSAAVEQCAYLLNAGEVDVANHIAHRCIASNLLDHAHRQPIEVLDACLTRLAGLSLPLPALRESALGADVFHAIAHADSARLRRLSLASKTTTEEVPLLSVIVPVHNVAPWLPDLLTSVLDQNMPSFEVIAIDDHSSDGSSELLRAHAARDPRLRVISPVGCGGASARNLGVAAASGTYIVFADGDDLVPQGAYQAMVASLERTGSDIVFGDYLKFNAIRTWRPTASFPAYNQPTERARFADQPSLVRGRPCWNKAFRRDFWIANGIEFPEVPRSNDIQPMVRAYLAASTVDVIGDVVYLYRERPGGTSMTAKASLSAGLVSYLEQELACAKMISGTQGEGLRVVYTDLFMVADGWVHLQRFAQAAHENGVETPSESVELVRSILDNLDPQRMRALVHHKTVPLLLFASGLTSEAQVLMRQCGAGEDPGEFLVEQLAAWVQAIRQFDAPGGPWRDLLKAVWSRQIAPRVLGAGMPSYATPHFKDAAEQVAHLQSEGGDAISHSKSGLVQRMRAALGEVGTPAWNTWLETRHTTGVDALQVSRVRRGVEITGRIPRELTNAQPVLAVYRGEHRRGRVIKAHCDNATWKAVLPSHRVPHGNASRLRVEFSLGPNLHTVLPIIVENTRLPRRDWKRSLLILPARGPVGAELEFKRIRRTPIKLVKFIARR